MEATGQYGCDLGCDVGCDLRNEVTPRTIPVFVGVSEGLGCDVGRLITKTTFDGYTKGLAMLINPLFYKKTSVYL